MLPQVYISLGLVFSGRVFAGDAQQPLASQRLQSSDECHNACTELVAVLGEQTSYGFIPDDFASSYWCTRQSEVIPACIIRPLTPKDVSVAIQAISKHSCHFAIKSGGHAQFPGASNADGGITIDLKHLNGLELSGDLSTAKIGPAKRWGDVYEVLEPLGLTVAGGRISDVGVGGFLLGGGISYLARKEGWASDTVRNYEIVLANGSVANVNLESHPDLYWALKGGGSNFGVVTRFDLEVYERDPVAWGGNIFYLFSDSPIRFASLNIRNPFSLSLKYACRKAGAFANYLVCLVGKCTTQLALFKAFEETLLTDKEADPYLHFYMAVLYWPKWNLLAGNMFMLHSGPVEEPSAFNHFTENVRPTFSSAKAQNKTDIMKEVDPYSPPGRWLYTMMTMTFDATVASQILDIFIQEIDSVKDVPGLFPAVVIHPLSTQVSHGSKKNGGNPFGFTGDERPLAMIQASPQWENAEDDEAMNGAIGRWLEKTIALAKEKGLYHPWIYQNYANKGQDVFAGYGEANRKRLKEIQKKYDPQGIFDRLQPGYFKI